MTTRKYNPFKDLRSKTPKLHDDFIRCFNQFRRFFPENCTMTYRKFLIYYAEIICLTDIQIFLDNLVHKCKRTFDIEQFCFYPATIYLVQICHPDFVWTKQCADDTFVVAHNYVVLTTSGRCTWSDELIEMFILLLDFFKDLGYSFPFWQIDYVIRPKKWFDRMISAHKGKVDIEFVNNLYRTVGYERLGDYFFETYGIWPTIYIPPRTDLQIANVYECEDIYYCGHFDTYEEYLNSDYDCPDISWCNPNRITLEVPYSKKLNKIMRPRRPFWLQHNQILDYCLALYSLNLPSYVLLWIIEFTFEKLVLTHGQRIKLIVTINETWRRKMTDRRLIATQSSL